MSLALVSGPNHLRHVVMCGQAQKVQGTVLNDQPARTSPAPSAVKPPTMKPSGSAQNLFGSALEAPDAPALAHRPA